VMSKASRQRLVPLAMETPAPCFNGTGKTNGVKVHFLLDAVGRGA
jgi:hypothetical protein